MQTQTDNTENNILIAEFMGSELGEANCYTGVPVHGMKTITCSIDTMKFHNNYNWLLPVAKKIFSKDFEQECKENNFDLWVKVPVYIMDNISNSILFEEIKTLYNAVIAFINWYNENKTK